MKITIGMWAFMWSMMRFLRFEISPKVYSNATTAVVNNQIISVLNLDQIN